MLDIQKREKPLFILAPMAEVTDVVFREFISTYTAPDIFFTEFVSCKGLLSSKGKEHLIRDLFYTQKQRPIIAQVFGGDPKDFTPVAKLLESLGFDGIDINMGCPDKKVEKQGAGAALINDPKRAREIVQATRKGAGKMSVSIKTRIGYNVLDTENWIKNLCQTKPDFITVHARTRKEMSKVEAHWDEIEKAVTVASEYQVPIIGNGDVKSRKQGEFLAEKTGVSGIMIGRAVYGNPWVFDTDEKDHSWEERLKALFRLIFLFDSFWGKNKNYDILKRFFKSYLHGFVGAKELRIRMMETREAKEALKILFEEISLLNTSFEEAKEKISLELANTFS
ncbi:MAG: tRNA-dihydrouridine synthase [Candidatus Moraniibacteriota bacterium]|nr:MAG: tRNA-dihydrouridine synthase [Candidatus Moranbacteria bacterium]